MKLLIALSLLSVNAFADFHKGACKDDVQKFCADVKAGHGAVMQCLKSHQSELSEGCKANGQAMKEKMKDFKEACQADIKQHCGDVKRGQGRIIECLKTTAGVSEGCKSQLPNRHGKAD